MKKKFKKIIKIADQCVKRRLKCDFCEENIFLKPVYLAKYEIPIGNFGYVVCEKCYKEIKIYFTGK